MAEAAKEARYDEADSLKLKIDEIKKSLVKKKKKDLEYRHIIEMDNLEVSYKREVDALNESWNLKFSDWEERSKGAEENLNSKHKKEMEELYSFLEDNLPKNVKFSREYLELKNQEENLVKQQRYESN